jgi:anaerobic ribonucleoside-triphosphate reductase activating protein
MSDRRSEPVLRVARFLSRTLAEGPGLRSAIWVQGCSIRCPGCFNPHMIDFRGGTPHRSSDLVTQVLGSGSSGLTLLGGEPFDQAPAAAAVATGVGQAGRSVVTFTGYELADLRSAEADGRQGVAELLAATDLLVAGPFHGESLDRTRPWVGSTNQQFIALHDRFPEMLEAVGSAPDRVEIRVEASGQITVNGWADPSVLESLLDGPHRRPNDSTGPV